MDLTPKFAKMDVSEDSGCITSSSLKTSSSMEASSMEALSSMDPSSYIGSSQLFEVSPSFEDYCPLVRTFPPDKTSSSNKTYPSVEASSPGETSSGFFEYSSNNLLPPAVNPFALTHSPLQTKQKNLSLYTPTSNVTSRKRKLPHTSVRPPVKITCENSSDNSGFIGSNLQTPNLQTPNLQTSNLQTSYLQTSYLQTSSLQTSTHQTSIHQTSTMERLTLEKSSFERSIDTPQASPWCVSSRNFLSSTLNESMGFEHFISENLTPNFYLERPEEKCHPILKTPTLKAPMEKHQLDKDELAIQDIENGGAKTLNEVSLPISQIESTPPTAPQYNATLNVTDSFSLPKQNSTQKLGSPERYELLYPDRYFVGEHTPFTPLKDLAKKSPQPKRFTPAKKRLFGFCKREKLDPVPFFTNDKRRFQNILDIILSCLPDEDLYNFSLVSAKWKAALYNSKLATRRLNNYLTYCRTNKENFKMKTDAVERYRWQGRAGRYSMDSNINLLYGKKGYLSGTPAETPRKAPLSPRSKNFQPFLEHSKYLKEGQYLQKCPSCKYVAIIDKNIGQCQRKWCQYIYCLECYSFSTTGPENFHDKCQMSQLEYDVPRRRSLLSDSPLRESDCKVPFFLKDSSWNSKCDLNSSVNSNSNIDSSAQNWSSGYITDAELAMTPFQDSSGQERRRSTHEGSNVQERSGPLKNFNRDLVDVRKPARRMSYLATVIPISSRKSDVMESPPSTPPKVSVAVAGSAKSKKNLKRLLM